jgi:hypothetical protein
LQTVLHRSGFRPVEHRGGGNNGIAETRVQTS